MPAIVGRRPSYKPQKTQEINWETFRKGLNTLLRETELEDDELAEADNLMLIGKGVPTKRWGTDLYFQSNSTGSVRALKGYYQTDGTNTLLSITDNGYLTYKNGASWASVNGASWASGSMINMEQISDNMYIVSNNRELTRLDNTTLTGFPTISTPGSLFATQISGTSGTNTYGYRVSAVSNVGETLAATTYELANQPQDLVDGTVKVTWSATSTASGVLQGYNVYGRTVGDERFLGFVGKGSTTFIDDGSAIPKEFTYPPTADSTGGPKCKYIMRFQDRMILAGIDGEPEKVMISGRDPNHEKFDVSYGGNYIIIEPDSGDPITGLSTFEEKIIVFKERSVWQVSLSTEQIGNFFVTIPRATLITKSHGCIAPGSIAAVENDVFFLTRSGVYALGYEPNILNVLRTNEISAKIRPNLDILTIAQKTNAVAFYDDNKYGLAFPGTNKTYVYDRERLSWTGPWTKDARVFEKYFDSSNESHLIYGEDDAPDVVEYLESAGTDEGASIETSLRTKKADFGDWTVFKSIRTVFTLLRNIKGAVNISIRIQDRNGNLRTIKQFTITSTSVSNSGWGADLFGNTQWGDSEEVGGASDINEVYRWVKLNKTARNIQLIITSSGSSNYELLAIRASGKPIGLGFLPSSERA